jgi:hypothetical protein
MTTRPTIFSAAPSVILAYPDLFHAASSIPIIFSSIPLVHFVIVPNQMHTRFYVMSATIFRQLTPDHPACGMSPTFSGTLIQLRTLLSAFPPNLFTGPLDAPNP